LDFQTKLKDFFSLATSNLVASLILGIFWVFLASILSKNEYGELGFLMSIANVGLAVSMLGLGSTIVVYESKNEKLFSPSLALIFFASCIAAIFTYVLIQNFTASLLIIGLSISSLILAGLNSKKQYSSYSIQNIIKAALSLVFALVLFEIFGINGILLGYFIATLFLLKNLPKLMKNSPMSLSLLKSKVGFMLNNLAHRLSHVIFWWGDKLLIGILFGFTTLGVYHFAAQYLLLIESIPRAIGLYLLPQESEGQKNKTIKIFFILIACFIAIISILVVPEFINIFLSEFEESILPIQIMSLSIIPITIYTIQQAEFLGKENSKIVLFGSVIQTALYFVLIIILGEWYGLIGISIGFFVSMIVRVIFNFLINFYHKY